MKNNNEFGETASSMEQQRDTQNNRDTDTNNVHIKVETLDAPAQSALRINVKSDPCTPDPSTPRTVKSEFDGTFSGMVKHETQATQSHMCKSETNFTQCSSTSIKQEIHLSPQSLDVKVETVDSENDDGSQIENGCTNSGCNLQKQCLHTYRCKKCNAMFTEQQSFSSHFRLCRTQSSLVASTSSNSSSRKTTYDIDFNNINMRKLIECIRVNPCLYDSDNDDYNDTHLKEVVWSNIAYKCGFGNGEHAKTTWKKLQDAFYENLVQESSHIEHNSLTSHRPFRYHKQMEFLLSEVSDIRPEETENCAISESFMSYQDPDIIPSPAKKQKTSNTRKKKEKSSEPLRMFFLSMCETTKNLSPHLQLQVKRKVFQAVIEAEEFASSNEANANSTSHLSNNEDSSLSSLED